MAETGSGAGAACCWAKRAAGADSPAAVASESRARTFTSDLLVQSTENVRGIRTLNHSPRGGRRQTAGPELGRFGGVWGRQVGHNRAGVWDRADRRVFRVGREKSAGSAQVRGVDRG